MNACTFICIPRAYDYNNKCIEQSVTLAANLTAGKDDDQNVFGGFQLQLEEDAGAWQHNTCGLHTPLGVTKR